MAGPGVTGQRRAPRRALAPPPARARGRPRGSPSCTDMTQTNSHRAEPGALGTRRGQPDPGTEAACPNPAGPRVVVFGRSGARGGDRARRRLRPAAPGLPAAAAATAQLRGAGRSAKLGAFRRRRRRARAGERPGGSGPPARPRTHSSAPRLRRQIFPGRLPAPRPRPQPRPGEALQRLLTAEPRAGGVRRGAAGCSPPSPPSSALGPGPTAAAPPPRGSLQAPEAGGAAALARPVAGWAGLP